MACGCTDDDCSQCVERTGAPCAWAAPHLCSACVGDVVAVGDRYVVRGRREAFERSRMQPRPAAFARQPGRVLVCWTLWPGQPIPAEALWVVVHPDAFALVKALAEQGRVRL